MFAGLVSQAEPPLHVSRLQNRPDRLPRRRHHDLRGPDRQGDQQSHPDEGQAGGHPPRQTADAEGARVHVLAQHRRLHPRPQRFSKHQGLVLLVSLDSAEVIGLGLSAKEIQGLIHNLLLMLEFIFLFARVLADLA